MDLPNQEVVNSSQNDRIFKDISKNDRSKKNIKKEVSKVHCLKGKCLKAHSEESSVKDSKTLFKIDKTQSHAI
jgi:hypothetical protein